MKLHCIVGKYYDTYADATMPTILDVWDEYVRDENPEGYWESLARYQKQVNGNDLAGVAEITLEAPDEEFVKLFKPDEYVVRAEVIK